MDTIYHVKLEIQVQGINFLFSANEVFCSLHLTTIYANYNVSLTNFDLINLPDDVELNYQICKFTIIRIIVLDGRGVDGTT